MTEDIKIFISGKIILDHIEKNLEFDFNSPEPKPWELNKPLVINFKTDKTEMYIDPIFYIHEDGTAETICSSNKERIKELGLEDIEWVGN